MRGYNQAPDLARLPNTNSEGAYAALDYGDVEGAAENLADRIEWIVPGHRFGAEVASRVVGRADWLSYEAGRLG